MNTCIITSRIDKSSCYYFYYPIVGVGLSHLTGKGKALIEAAMKIGIRKLTVDDLNPIYIYISIYT